MGQRLESDLEESCLAFGMRSQIPTSLRRAPLKNLASQTHRFRGRFQCGRASGVIQITNIVGSASLTRSSIVRVLRETAPSPWLLQIAEGTKTCAGLLVEFPRQLERFRLPLVHEASEHCVKAPD
jgi:hypothetical protein